MGLPVFEISPVQESDDGQTDGQTDRQTDGRTPQTYRPQSEGLGPKKANARKLIKLIDARPIIRVEKYIRALALN